MGIRIDHGNMMAPAVAGGIPEATWQAAAARFEAAQRAVDERRRAGELGFLELVDAQPGLDYVRRFADGVGQAFSDILVLGIGGSALGTVALRSALRSPAWNTLSDEVRSFYPRLHVLENVDPMTMVSLLERLELAKTLLIVISKSGGTAETMAQYLIARDRLERELGDRVTRHLVFITDPTAGALRAIAGREPVISFDIPPNVGGRFSVLTPVGLLPAALIGVDVTALLAGAAEMRRRCETSALEQNPAGSFAVLQWLADSELGLRIHVLMPYADALRDFSAWFVQLWAESLGKTRPDGTAVGPTPLAALGATDQHSQVQLFMEGPLDKTVTFVGVARMPVDVVIPTLHRDVPELAYLGGHTLKELLDAERLATAGALARRGRPNMTIEIGEIDAWHLGGLIMLFELATVYAGALYGVNPLDQPGVELGKQFTYAMLRRPDAQRARQEWEAQPQPESRWIG